MLLRHTTDQYYAQLNHHPCVIEGYTFGCLPNFQLFNKVLYDPVQQELTSNLA